MRISFCSKVKYFLVLICNLQHSFFDTGCMINKKYFLLILFFGLLYSSCHNEQKNISDSSPVYDVYVRYENPSNEYIIRVNSLSEGEVNPRKDGAKIAKEIHYGLTVQGDKYYYLNERTHFIKQYQIQNNIFESLDSIPVTNIECLESILWISKDTLLMVGLHQDLIRPAYALVETKSMSLITEGTIDIPHFETITWSKIGFLQRNNSNIFLGFYPQPKDTHSDSVTDKMCIAIFDFPAMTVRQIETVNQFARTLNDNRYQPSSVQDEDGNIYFLSSASDRLLEPEDQNKGYSSGILKIKKGTTNVDPEYFINTNNSTAKGNVYGIWYMGQGKAIIKCDVPQLIKNWDDYDEYAYTYFEVDLNTQTLSKINIPLDRGWYLDNVLIDDGLVYIANKTESNENYIWIYNPINKTTTKGTKINGDFHSFGRINRVK